MTEVVITKGSGIEKCARCGRTIKNIFMANGAPYGPVCIRKLFGINVAVTGLGTYKKPEVPEGQDIIDFSDTPVAYVGSIVYDASGNDTDRIITAMRPNRTYALDLRLDLANHSPTGFCWGYLGSGPAQAALAILADYLGDDARARLLHQDFKSRVLAKFPMPENFTLTAREIEDTITAIEIERMKQ